MNLLIGFVFGMFVGWRLEPAYKAYHTADVEGKTPKERALAALRGVLGL